MRRRIDFRGKSVASESVPREKWPPSGWLSLSLPHAQIFLSNLYTPSPSRAQISRSILKPHEDDHARPTRETSEVKQVVSDEVLQMSFIHPAQRLFFSYSHTIPSLGLGSMKGKY